MLQSLQNSILQSSHKSTSWQSQHEVILHLEHVQTTQHSSQRYCEKELEWKMRQWFKSGPEEENSIAYLLA